MKQHLLENRQAFVLHPPAFILILWSGRRDLNSRPSPWQGDALPLSYSRSLRKSQSSKEESRMYPFLYPSVKHIGRKRKRSGLVVWDELPPIAPLNSLG